MNRFTIVAQRKLLASQLLYFFLQLEMMNPCYHYAQAHVVLGEPFSQPMSPVHFQRLGKAIDALQLMDELCHKLRRMSVLDFPGQANDF